MTDRPLGVTVLALLQLLGAFALFSVGALAMILVLLVPSIFTLLLAAIPLTLGIDVDKDSGGVGKAKDHIKHLLLLKELMEAGKLSPVIDSTYTFDQIPAAHEYVATGRKRGCIVVTVITKGE